MSYWRVFNGALIRQMQRPALKLLAPYQILVSCPDFIRACGTPISCCTEQTAVQDAGAFKAP
eukprot:6184403-Pleurochrysis_carterae.AAC.4